MPRMVKVSGDLFLPSTVLAEMQAINTGAGILFHNVNLDPKISDSLRKSVVEYWESWVQYYKENKGWLSRAVNTTYETVRDFRSRFEELRIQYVSEGGKGFVPGLARRGKLSEAKTLTQLAVAGLVGAVLFWALKR